MRILKPTVSRPHLEQADRVARFRSLPLRQIVVVYCRHDFVECRSEECALAGKQACRSINVWIDARFYPRPSAQRHEPDIRIKFAAKDFRVNDARDTGKRPER